MRLKILFAVAAGVLALGIPLWPLAYSEVSFPERPSVMVWMLTGGLAGILAGMLIREGVRKPAASVAAGFIIAVMFRVSLEVALDPTSHNLWPFEAVYAGVMGMTSGLSGVGVARLIQRLTS